MPSFETEIKPLFRESDRESMLRSFDLWSHDDVSQHADAAWPQEQLDLFQRWAEASKPR